MVGFLHQNPGMPSAGRWISLLLLRLGTVGRAAGTCLVVVASAATAMPAGAAAPRLGPNGLLRDAMDRATRPGDDFFQFAVGRYTTSLSIPADREQNGVLSQRARDTTDQVRALVLESTSCSACTDAQRRVGRLYRSYMAPDASRHGLQALQANLQAIHLVKTRQQVAAAMGRSFTHFGAAILDIHVSPDDKDPSIYAVNIHQAGLGLPAREQYFGPNTAELLTRYEAYVAQILSLSKWHDPAGSARAIVAFEKRIAEVSWNMADQRDPEKTYNVMSRAQFATAAAGFPVGVFLDAAGLAQQNRFILNERSAISSIAAIFGETDVDTLKAWLAFNVADASAAYLPQAFVRARFDFRDKVLGGRTRLAPRWRRAIEAAETVLADDIGTQYVARHFSAASRRGVDSLVARVRAAFAMRIQHAPWLSNSTRAEALAKLAKVSIGIGFPDHPKAYDFVLARNDLYGNMERGKAWAYRNQIGKLGAPVDRTAWGLPAYALGAEYNTSLNRMTFPAANLQPPFFDPAADPAVNYGAIGVVIGHELSHGFDDQGRKVDADGRLRNWWTDTDAHAFESRAARVAAQYDAFEPLPGVRINGRQTLGEDIADITGVAVALDAYHASLKGVDAPVINGLTGDQRFFLSCAQVWAQRIRPDALRNMLASDPHAPAGFRVNGEVRNIDAWYAAFGIAPSDKLYIAPPERETVW